MVNPALRDAIKQRNTLRLTMQSNQYGPQYGLFGQSVLSLSFDRQLCADKNVIHFLKPVLPHWFFFQLGENRRICLLVSWLLVGSVVTEGNVKKTALGVILS